MKLTPSKWILLITLVISLTACGQQTEQQSQAENQPKAISESKPSAVTNEPQKQAEKPVEEPLNNDNQVAKTYIMNKVYNIVPAKDGTEKKVVLLTFDDGPKDEKMINRLIDTLDKHHAKAIFFVNGYRVKAHPELLKLIHDREQVIGNHSWDHINLKKESEASIKKQIEDVQKIVKDTVGESPKFFRPPFGLGNDTVRSIVKNNGMLFMTWSNGSLDWDSKNKNKPDAVIKNVLEQLHPGSNILMHELPWTVDASDELLTKLEDKGYSFVNPLAIDIGEDIQ
ncbi:polysaccharide deacetylase family protein [Paenibacillus guangzhouensis]|uniref:polysaccharide deacetylase family protein n=1 Tax=Paenibacillus guangzhouensis TaxID=1473112 RepID=UPI001266B8AB|nr:polysaccharide deacetylase family protein [Paenibacillus guangzhouensis]